MPVTVRREGDVFILNLGDGENRFNPSSMSAIHESLDAVEACPDTVSLVTTASSKFFSNGLDLNWLMTHKSAGEHQAFMEQFHGLLARLLTFPVPTVCAINGHAVAGGCMLALAHDYRVMQAEKGFLFVNEVDIGLPLTPGMCALLGSKMAGPVFRDAVLTGKRYAADAAVAAGLVDGASADPLKDAIALAGSLRPKGADRGVFMSLKREMYKAPHAALLAGGLGAGSPPVGKLSAALTTRAAKL